MMLCCEPSLAELGNLGTLGNLPALFVLVLENCKGREKCSSLSWTKMTQKLHSQQSPTLFWVVWGWCVWVFFVSNFSSADCLFEIHSIIGKECLFVRQVHPGCSGGSKSVYIQQYITWAYTSLSLRFSDGIAKKVVL